MNSNPEATTPFAATVVGLDPTDEPGTINRRRLLSGALAAGAGLLLAGCGESAPRSLESAKRRASRAHSTHHFVSRPDLKPPKVTVVHPARGTAPGHVLSAPSSGPGQRGVLILDDDGEPVWFQPTPHKAATNFQAALYRGAPVLTWWEGKTEHGLGDGDHVVVDQTY